MLIAYPSRGLVLLEADAAGLQALVTATHVPRHAPAVLTQRLVLACWQDGGLPVDALANVVDTCHALTHLATCSRRLVPSDDADATTLIAVHVVELHDVANWTLAQQWLQMWQQLRSTLAVASPQATVMLLAHTHLPDAVAAQLATMRLYGMGLEDCQLSTAAHQQLCAAVQTTVQLCAKCVVAAGLPPTPSPSPSPSPPPSSQMVSTAQVCVTAAAAVPTFHTPRKPTPWQSLNNVARRCWDELQRADADLPAAKRQCTV
jgi:hypothetical protein